MNAQKSKHSLKLETLNILFSVCKVSDYSEIDMTQPFCFFGSTDEEKSLVCPVKLVPDHGIGIFAISTFNTDYVLTKEEDFQRALDALHSAGYDISQKKDAEYGGREL